MIRTKEDYLKYLELDKKALGIKHKSPKLFSDTIWRFERLLRKREYWHNCPPVKIRIIQIFVRKYLQYRYKSLSERCGFSIPINVFGPGLAIVHLGTIVVSAGAKIGANCRIHEGVTIGATNHSNKAAFIGDNVFIGSGAKIIGEIKISDNVAIAANAVVVKDVDLPNGGTVGGVPARLISKNTSALNLVCPSLL